MKKMAAFLMAFTLACTSSSADLHTGAAIETVYAAQAVAISSEADLVAMQEIRMEIIIWRKISRLWESESVSELL